MDGDLVGQGEFLAEAADRGGEAEKGAAKLTEFIDQWPQDVNVPEARYLLARTLRQLGRAAGSSTGPLAPRDTTGY